MINDESIKFFISSSGSEVVWRQFDRIKGFRVGLFCRVACGDGYSLALRSPYSKCFFFRTAIGLTSTICLLISPATDLRKIVKTHSTIVRTRKKKLILGFWLDIRGILRFGTEEFDAVDELSVVQQFVEHLAGG